MKSWKESLAAGVLVLGTLALSGCGSDPVAPQDSYDVDAESAAEWSLQAIGMISRMAAAVPTVSQGDFSSLGPGKSAEEPAWDEEQMAWVLDRTVSFTEGDPPTSTGQTRISVWIQFRGAEGAQFSPLEATGMEYRESAGMSAHYEHEQGASDLDFDLATRLSVDYLETGYDMAGTGQAEVSATATAEERTERMQLSMTWSLDLVTPSGGCPAGTAFVQVGRYRTDVVYDGQGNADWTLTGPGFHAQGTETVPCGGSM